MNVIEYFILHLLLFSAVSQSLRSAEWPQHTRCAHGGDGPEPTLRRHALSPYGAFPLPALRGFCLVCESSFVLKLPNVLREKLIACVRLTHGSSSWSKIFVDLAEGSGGAAREGLRAQPSRPVTPLPSAQRAALSLPPGANGPPREARRSHVISSWHPEL